MAEIRRSPLNVSSFSHYLQVFLMPSRWCRISEPSTVLLRQMVGITQNQVLFLLKKILLPFNWKVKKTGTKIWWIWNNLPRFLRWHGDFKYQLWFHFTTFSHSKKKQPPALAGLVRHLWHVMVSPSNCSNVAWYVKIPWSFDEANIKHSFFWGFLALQ